MNAAAEIGYHPNYLGKLATRMGRSPQWRDTRKRLWFREEELEAFAQDGREQKEAARPIGALVVGRGRKGYNKANYMPPKLRAYKTGAQRSSQGGVDRRGRQAGRHRVAGAEVPGWWLRSSPRSARLRRPMRPASKQTLRPMPTSRTSSRASLSVCQRARVLLSDGDPAEGSATNLAPAGGFRHITLRGCQTQCHEANVRARTIFDVRAAAWSS